MKFREAVKAIPARFKRPAIWGSCLAWLFLGKIIYMVTQARYDLAQYGIHVPAAKFLNSFMDPVIVAILGPFAWQWTGDAKLLGGFGRSLLQVIGVTAAGYLILKWPLGFMTPPSNTNAVDPFGIASGIIVTLAIFLTAAVIGRVIAWSEQQTIIQQQALAQAQEAQWTLLRSQLSPHLVLNVLNGLAGLAEENPGRAARGLEDLAEVYGQILELGEVERIPLAWERDLLQRYLSVEQLRLETALRVTWHWDTNLDALTVPPLLLQPLVENAIKHGINAYPGGGDLIIKAETLGHLVNLSVSNTGGALHRSSAQAGAGVGIRNLKRRLVLTYGDRATLSLTEDGAWTCATILIPAQVSHFYGATR